MKVKASEVYYIEKEISMWQKELDQAETKANRCRKKIEKLLARSVQKKKELYTFIDSVDDSYIRMLLNLRCIKGLTWEQITDELGGSSCSHKMALKRFLDKTQE